jgi:hypothetical protein
MWVSCKRENIQLPGQRKATLDEHLQWMKEQHDAGHILMSAVLPQI